MDPRGPACFLGSSVPVATLTELSKVPAAEHEPGGRHYLPLRAVSFCSGVSQR